MARTEQESNRRRREEKWKICWCCRDQQRACRMAQVSAKKLEHTGPDEKEWPQCHRKRAVGEYAKPALAKRNKAVCPEYQIVKGERVKMNVNRILARKRGSEQQHEEERVDSTVNEGRVQGEKG